MSQPRIAIVGTGGTISSKGATMHELVTYIDRGDIYTAEEVVKNTPGVSDFAEPVVVPFSAVPSTEIGPENWLALVRTVNQIPEDFDNIDGIVITHGTASLEETAWFLNMTVKVDCPVVVVGAQRPHTGISTDAYINLVNAMRVAASPVARGLGVLVCLNTEIHAAREVTKTSTFRLQTFQAPEFGALGHVDHDSVNIYRQSLRAHAPDTEFDVRDITEFPRVDIAYCWAGADGVAVEASVAAGARGIVVAGFAPGLVTVAMLEALNEASAKGVTIVQSSRAGSGRVTLLKTKHAAGTITADNLNPQKARVLLMLALTTTSDHDEIQQMFERY